MVFVVDDTLCCYLSTEYQKYPPFWVLLTVFSLRKIKYSFHGRFILNILNFLHKIGKMRDRAYLIVFYILT